MIYHPIQFSCQKISRCSRNSHIWLNEPSQWPWTWRQQTNLLAWQFGPWYVASPYKVCLEKVSSWGDIIQMNIHWNSEPFLWPWPWPQQSNPFFSQDNPPVMMCHQIKFSCKRISSSDNILKRHFCYIIYNCDLDLEDSKTIFLKENLARNDASPYQVW